MPIFRSCQIAPPGDAVEVADHDDEADIAFRWGLLEGGKDDVAVVLAASLPFASDWHESSVRPAVRLRTISRVATA